MTLVSDKLVATRVARGAVPHTDGAGAFVPDQSRAERRTSYAVADFPVPGGREEDWRFAPVDRLARLFAADGNEAGAVTVKAHAPEGVELLDLAMDDARVGTAFRPADRAAVTAWAGTDSAFYVGIPAETELTQPVQIRLSGMESGTGSGMDSGMDSDTDAGRSNAHLVVDVGRHSRGTVVLTHSGTAMHTGNVEIRVGDGADLTFVSVQEWDDDALHLGQHDVLVGRDAHVKHIAITLGGQVVRVCTNARYAGPGGSFEGLGVYFADAGQHQEHRLFVDHEPPSCISRVQYKGALQGDSAHTVWVGDVLIRATAEGTDTYELNRNLVLTEGARADSVPNLEIETGEIIGAGHASATGRFDDEQLFYLQSRGISEDEARRLVVRGFFADIVHRIGVPDVQEHLMAAIDAELSLSLGAATTIGSLETGEAPHVERASA